MICKSIFSFCPLRDDLISHSGNSLLEMVLAICSLNYGRFELFLGCQPKKGFLDYCGRLPNFLNHDLLPFCYFFSPLCSNHKFGLFQVLRRLDCITDVLEA